MRLAPVLAVALLALVPAGSSAAPGDTTLVSRAGLRGPSADASAVAPSLSGDGRLVAFVSDAKNLSADSVSRVASVYVRDRLIGWTTLVSRASGATGPGGAWHLVRSGHLGGRTAGGLRLRRTGPGG